MSLLIEQYTRKPFTIDAVQVTLDNMEEVAKWAGGEIVVEKRGERLIQFIKIDVNRPLNDRQTKAFVEDWVLRAGSGFKCYSKKAFPACFVKKESSDEQNLWPYTGQEPLFEAPSK
jgi:hypothetical protein